jgi:hypothetical protein
MRPQEKSNETSGIIRFFCRSSFICKSKKLASKFYIKILAIKNASSLKRYSEFDELAIIIFSGLDNHGSIVYAAHKEYKLACQ